MILISNLIFNLLVRMNTFKPPKIPNNQQHQQQKRNKYDENQYLSPAEYHSYSAVDSDTQFYMDDGLSSIKRCRNVDDDVGSNNYVEVMDELDELARSRTNGLIRTSSSPSSSTSDSITRSNSSDNEDAENLTTKTFKRKSPNVSCEKSPKQMTSQQQTSSAAIKSSTFNLVLIDSNENLKAKKILQRI